MARVTPQQAAEKWQRRLSGASQDYINGVQSVTEAPGRRAAAAANKAAQNYQAKIADGSWARRVGNVSLGEWQQQAATKGAQRLASGAAAATPKMEGFMSEFLPYVDSARAEIDRMPNNSLEDAKARMLAWTDRMARFSRR